MSICRAVDRAGPGNTALLLIEHRQEIEEERDWFIARGGRRAHENIKPSVSRLVAVSTYMIALIIGVCVCVCKFVLHLRTSTSAWQAESGRTWYRGGAKHRDDPLKDPRTQIVMWAVDRAPRIMPDIPEKTLELLMNAEARTAFAIMSCKKADQQIKEVVMAAMKRGNSNNPVSSGRSEIVDKFAENLENLRNLTEKVETQEPSHLPDAQRWRADCGPRLLSTAPTHIPAENPSTDEAVAALAQCVAALEKKIQEWETTFLQ